MRYMAGSRFTRIRKLPQPVFLLKWCPSTVPFQTRRCMQIGNAYATLATCDAPTSAKTEHLAIAAPQSQLRTLLRRGDCQKKPLDESACVTGSSQTWVLAMASRP